MHVLTAVQALARLTTLTFSVTGSLSYSISKATVDERYDERRLMLRRPRGDKSKEYFVAGNNNDIHHYSVIDEIIDPDEKSFDNLKTMSTYLK